MIEVVDRRFGKRLAERRHALLPLLFPDHRESLDVGEIFNAELKVLPRCARFPAMKTGHIEQEAQLSVLPDEPLELGHKVRVVLLYQLPADVNDEDFAGVFFLELNGYSLLHRLGSG